MAFTLTVRAGPARLASRLPQLAKSSSTPLTATRAFHQSTKNNTFFTSKTASLALRSNAKPKLVSRLQGASRGYQQGQYAAQPDRSQLIKKMLVGGAIVGGTWVTVQAMFNGESREGGIPAYERKYLNQSFAHLGLGIGVIGLSAYKMVTSGFVYRIMVTNPWVVGLGGLALSFGSMIATRSIDADNYIPKYAAWTVFNATQAAMIAPLLTMAGPALIARAGLYTIAMMGGLTFVGATAKQDKYLYIGGPLLAGACIVAVSGFAPLVLSANAVRTLAWTENIWLYGGLAVFGGFTLYDVQKIQYKARLAERGLYKPDPVNEAISLELDFLNIFIRMVQILMLRGNNNRK